MVAYFSQWATRCRRTSCFRRNDGKNDRNTITYFVIVQKIVFYFLNLSIRHFSVWIPNTITPYGATLWMYAAPKLFFSIGLRAFPFTRQTPLFRDEFVYTLGDRPGIVWPRTLPTRRVLHVFPRDFLPIIPQTGTQADTFVRRMNFNEHVRRTKRGSVNVRLIF